MATISGSGIEGPLFSSLDYNLYMKNGTIIQEPLRLDSTSISDLTNDNRDAIEAEFTVNLRGQNTPRKIRLRSMQKLGFTFTVNYGFSIVNKLKSFAWRNRPQCETVLYMVAACPTDPRYEHAYILTDVKLDPPQRTVAPIVNKETGEPIDSESEGYGSEEIQLWRAGNYLVTTLSEPAYGVTAREVDCPDCNEEVFQDFVVVATDGASFNTYVTDDRFATVTDKTAVGSAAPSGSIPTSVYATEDVILVGFRNAGSTAGGTVISSDNGATATIDSNVSAPVYGVGRFDGQYVAVGGALGGQALFWYSDNGTAWTSVTNGALPANKALLSLSVDSDGSAIYAVGEDGLAVKIFKSGGSFNMSAITLPGSVSSTDINVVRVLAIDHVAVGGAGGYYAESLDGGTTWTRPAVTTTSAITALAGNVYNTVYGAATAIASRSVLNLNFFKNNIMQNGASITGNFTGGDSLHVGYGSTEERSNYYVLVTDDGEVVIGRPQINLV